MKHLSLLLLLGSCSIFINNSLDNFCGDGVTAGDEACDDGNFEDGDGCSAGCQLDSCGDAILDPGEACDDGNLIEGDGCDTNCTLSGCGNGILSNFEECDNGQDVAGDQCNDACKFDGCDSPLTLLNPGTTELSVPAPSGVSLFSGCENVSDNTPNISFHIKLQSDPLFFVKAHLTFLDGLPALPPLAYIVDAGSCGQDVGECSFDPSTNNNTVTYAFGIPPSDFFLVIDSLGLSGPFTMQLEMN